ncbi:MAG TPA: formyl transferase [Acidimicrobiales bacterium]|nr:formyl transferase [Acidimicrobiales bacterium]
MSDPGEEGGRGRAVLVCTDCPASRIVYHRLRAEVGDLDVVVEDRVPRARLLRRRLRRLGLLRVAGQVLFVAGVAPFLQWRGRRRIGEIMARHGLVDQPLDRPVRVRSINDEEARRALRALRPAVVVVCGTRIIGRETLGCVDAPFVNYHAGMTPAYRGVHGGYWALAEGRPDLAGSTVHLVDEGIDTGPVLEQRTFVASAADNFATYPYLHVAAALPAIVGVTRRALAGERLAGSAPASSAPSRLRSHPTLWGWVAVALRRGVR